MALDSLGYFGVRARKLDDWADFARQVPRHADGRPEPDLV